jgi:O-antigen/teichoic acid export membrane protein
MNISAILGRLRPHATRATWAVTDALIGPILLMAITPLLLQNLGVGGFGLWVLAISITGFGQLASVGVGVTTTKHVSSDLGNGKPAQAIAATRAALTVALIGGGLLMLVTAPLAPYLASAVFEKMGSPDTVAWALIWGVALLIVQEVDGVFAGALRGAQRYDIAAQVELVSRPIWAGVIIMAAWLFKEPLAVLTASLGVNILKVFLKGLRVKQVLGGNCFLPSRSKVDIRRTIEFGKWVWLQGIGGVLFGVLDRILIGAFFGAADLSRYSICLQLAQFVHGIQASAFQILMPWVSTKNANNKTTNTKLINKLAIWGGVLCLILPIAMGIMAVTVLGFWINPRFAAENSSICIVLLFAYGLLSFNIPCHFLLLGMNFAKYVALVNALAGLLSILFSIFLLPQGIIAFAIGKLIYAPVTLLNFIKLRRSENMLLNKNKL